MTEDVIQNPQHLYINSLLAAAQILPDVVRVK
jgi:hypothetical protein